MRRLSKFGLTWLHYVKDRLTGVSDQERDFIEWRTSRINQDEQMTAIAESTAQRHTQHTGAQNEHHDENTPSRYCEYDEGHSEGNNDISPEVHRRRFIADADGGPS